MKLPAQMAQAIPQLLYSFSAQYVGGIFLSRGIQVYSHCLNNTVAAVTASFCCRHFATTNSITQWMLLLSFEVTVAVTLHYEYYSLLYCDNVQSCTWILRLQRNILPPSSGFTYKLPLPHL